MTTRRSMAVVIAMATMSGCSFALVRPSPRRLPDEDAEPGKRGWMYCENYGTPAADLVGATLAGVTSPVAFVVWSQSETGYDDKEGNFVLFAAITGLALLYTASGIYGLVATHSCMKKLGPGTR